MDEIKNAVLCGCLLGIAFGIIKNIIPDKKLYNAMRTVMSLALTVVFIMPFLKGDIEISMPTIKEVSQTENEFLNSQLEKAYIKQIENTLSDKLLIYFEKENIIIKKLVIETYVDEYNFLEVNKVYVSCDNDDKDKVLKVIEDNLGENTAVEFDYEA